GSSQLGVSALDITTSSGVSSALSALDTAIATVGVQRGNIGNFVRNTLEASYRSLGVAKENLSAANSSIQDADMSEEMTNFTKLQILQQSGLAMLSQANSSSQAVLSLLRG
ncbi:MAG: flagellin, partial [Chthonomonas sp.]|nr:flagellin [Chthonomonas sp.]